MPTENPKISAYVPQAVYDRFKQFQEERGLSMSQATVELLVDYFGIDLANNSTEKITGGLPNRVTTLEKELFDLKQSYVWLVQKVESIQSTSELPINVPDIQSEIEDSSSPSDISGELKNDILTEVEKSHDSSPVGEPPRQLPLIHSDNILFDELLDDLKNNPLQGKYLSLRLGVSTSTLSIKKKELFADEFYDWIESKDIDGIRWVNLGEGRSKGYVPVDDTPLEKLQVLKDWIQVNI
jgi:hypothetical protein